MRFRFSAELWEWSAQGGWYFVAMPADQAEDIRALPRPPRGFGSVRVRARIGSTHWATSIFPDSTRGSYVLPVKKAVRAAEGIEEGDLVTVDLELVDF